MTETEKLVKSCIAGIQEKKGKKIRVVNLEGIDDTITKYLVIGEGNSPSQVAAITDSVCCRPQRTESTPIGYRWHTQQPLGCH